MPFEAAKELRRDRVSGDGNENSESHLRHAESNYVYIAKKYKWHYINCLKTDKYSSLEDIINKENPLVIILDHIEDPHNFGAIIRTCEATGVDGIIIPDDRCCEVNGTVVKTSVGTTERVKIARVKNLVNTMERLKKEGFWIFGTDMDGEDFRKLDYKGKTAIVCGNEGSGMSRLVRENCDFIASIPMQGTVNSLNASVATAVIIFEATRIRGL